MRTSHLVAFFAGGALLANAMPHLCAGITGSPFQTPFASPPGVGLSSSLTNVCWAHFNLLLAWLLLCKVGQFSLRNAPHAAALLAGMLAASLLCASLFGPLHGGNL